MTARMTGKNIRVQSKKERSGTITFDTMPMSSSSNETSSSLDNEMEGKVEGASPTG
jgi:hypothetical protein